MLRQRLLLTASSLNVAYAIFILLRHTSRRFVKEKSRSYYKTGGEDRISALPDDLLVRILMFLPTKHVVDTMILSKRWLSIWKMVPQLEYKEINDATPKSFLLGRLFGKTNQQQQSIWRYLDKSLQDHNARVLEKLVIELGPQCPIDVDVGKWIVYAVDHRVRELGFGLTWSTGPISLPKSIYTCDTLIKLCLSDKILVDVPSTACLSSLKNLSLYSVVYKDEDSLVRILSSCPILKSLGVERHHHDNVKKFNIKVPTLECLFYDNGGLGADNEGIEGSLVIDSPALKKIFIRDLSGDSCLIENKPRFDKAITYVVCYLDNTFMRSLSSVMYLELLLGGPNVVCCNAIKFSQLIECKIIFQTEIDWVEPLMLLLQNSPNLKILFIHQLFFDFPLSWTQPSSVPRCLSAHLEIFEWKEYGGRSAEKQVLRYIFANSECLKRAGIAMKSSYNLKDEKKMIIELESMSRVSTSSTLLFSTQLLENLNIGKEMTE